MSELEPILRALGRDLDYPVMQDQSEAVLSRLESRHRPRRRTRTLVVALAAAVIALAVVGLAVSQVRKRIFDWFGFAGERIEFIKTLPPLGDAQDLSGGAGPPVPLREAQRRLPFVAPIPRLEGLGPPDGVRLREDRTGRGSVLRLSLLWGKPHTYLLLFSAIPRTPVLAAQEGHIVRKRLGADFGHGRSYVWTRVHGSRALWISAPHQYIYTRRPNGFSFRTRVAQHVLLWQTGRFFFRLEGGLSLEQALRVAESVH
jgi:hypothetical protein